MKTIFLLTALLSMGCVAPDPARAALQRRQERNAEVDQVIVRNRQLQAQNDRLREQEALRRTRLPKPASTPR